MKTFKINKNALTWGVLLVLLVMGVGFSTAQTPVSTDQVGQNNGDLPPRFSQQEEMPTSKNLPTELTPPGQPEGALEPALTPTPSEN
ncbi:MAG TPA: hypothetical protein VK791_06295 [bacterium]|nr:hypothetical protein [bacterium]